MKTTTKQTEDFKSENYLNENFLSGNYNFIILKEDNKLNIKMYRRGEDETYLLSFKYSNLWDTFRTLLQINYNMNVEMDFNKETHEVEVELYKSFLTK